MNQIDHSLLERMNIQSDAIVANQCERNEIEKFRYKGHNITYLNFAERGVGLNRNNALLRADADICLFADDDMIYKNDYDKIIISAFEKHPDADILAFNIEETIAVDGHFVPKRKRIKREATVNFMNCLRYGTVRIAVKLNAIRLNGIAFNLSFGGGTKYCHGEDSLFIVSCLEKGLKMYSIPETIASMTEERESSWNNGYDEKYILDQGMLFRCMTKKYWKLLCLQDAIRRHKTYKMSFYKTYKMMIKGGERYNSEVSIK